MNLPPVGDRGEQFIRVYSTRKPNKEKCPMFCVPAKYILDVSIVLSCLTSYKQWVKIRKVISVIAHIYG